MKKEKKKTESSTTLPERLAKTLALSPDMLGDIPRFTMNGNRDLQIENYKGVLSYDMGEIKLGSKNYTIRITGRELQIVIITDDDITITGEISSISFI